MYKGLFSEDHHIASVDLNGARKTIFYPNGIYDSNILCKECDNKILGSLESYSKIILWGGNGKPKSYHSVDIEADQSNNKLLHISNIDYNKFKRFLLSILWRASISKQDIFKRVSLGIHEDRIRDMILENNPGHEDDYAVGLILLTPNKTCPTKIICDPQLLKTEKSLSYLFLINGFIINYKIEGSKFDDIYSQIAIKEDNTMDVIVLNEEETIFYMDKYMKGEIRYK